MRATTESGATVVTFEIAASPDTSGTHNTLCLDNGKLVGRTVERYATSGPDSGASLRVAGYARAVIQNRPVGGHAPPSRLGR